MINKSFVLFSAVYETELYLPKRDFSSRPHAGIKLWEQMGVTGQDYKLQDYKRLWFWNSFAKSRTVLKKRNYN